MPRLVRGRQPPRAAADQRGTRAHYTMYSHAVYRVSHKSVYAFSNLNISNMLDAIYFKFLVIVGLTFIFMHMKFQGNRPSHF